jgi:hypothetical protein
VDTTQRLKHGCGTRTNLLSGVRAPGPPTVESHEHLVDEHGQLVSPARQDEPWRRDADHRRGQMRLGTFDGECLKLLTMASNKDATDRSHIVS